MLHIIVEVADYPAEHGFVMSGQFCWIFMEVRARVRAAAPAARKPNMSEQAGHQSGLRVLDQRFPPQREEGSM